MTVSLDNAQTHLRQLLAGQLRNGKELVAVDGREDSAEDASGRCSGEGRVLRMKRA